MNDLAKEETVELLVLYHHIIIFLFLAVRFFCCFLLAEDFCSALLGSVSRRCHCFSSIITALSILPAYFFSSSTFLHRPPINTTISRSRWASSCGSTAKKKSVLVSIPLTLAPGGGPFRRRSRLVFVAQIDAYTRDADFWTSCQPGLESSVRVVPFAHHRTSCGMFSGSGDFFTDPATVYLALLSIYSSVSHTHFRLYRPPSHNLVRESTELKVFFSACFTPCPFVTH